MAAYSNEGAIELQATSVPSADSASQDGSKKQKAEEHPTFDLERTASRASARRQSAAVEWFQFSTLCLCLFLGGWNDASLGPLLSTIQNYYGVRPITNCRSLRELTLTSWIIR